MTVFLGSVLTCAFAPAKAIPAPSVMSKPMELLESKTEKRFSMDLGFSNSQNLMEASQYEKKNGFALELAPAYQISDNSSVSALTAIILDPKDRENTAILKATAVAWSLTKYKLDDKVSFSPILIGVLPTNQVQNQEEKYFGGVGIKGAISFSGLLNSSFDISLATSIRKNFNEYTINSAGDPLIEYSFPQEVKILYKISPSFSASLLNRYIFAKTYGGFDRQKFLADLNFNYEINKTWSMNTGVTNEGDAFKADGVQSNYRLFNAETTEVYLGLGISI